MLDAPLDIKSLSSALKVELVKATTKHATQQYGERYLITLKAGS